ncbi:hypothetical protein [Prevotella sp. OH937_COT-195]|uniref:hypothetical protein n=1 Tax=Prevotella sp. OH937_COT-195 TaxID=2491051 RepID=UPI000F65467A|nr:hypothetical protein [Prevotella sp. OH937_COT-195]RRD00956.1 hypothetical protein EII32_05870 [Prevotella sp. OH937_COT-195]
MPLPSRFPTALARLLISLQLLHLDVARYAFDETAAHLLNNRTKPVEGSNDRFGFKTSTKRSVVITNGEVLKVWFRIFNIRGKGKN